MKQRDHLKRTLTHQQPDRLVVDFGSTPVTGIHASIVEQLRDFYGLEKRPVKVDEPYQMLGMIEDDLVEALGIDVHGIPARKTMFGFINENWKEFRLPWGQVVLVSEHFQTTEDVNGDLLIYPEGDRSAPASARMPRDSFFFDSIIRQEPLDEDKLNPEDNLEEFSGISEEDIRYFADRVAELQKTGKGIVANFGGTALGDIALVPGPFMKYPKGIRDITEWYMSTLTRPDYIHTIFSKQTDIALKNLQKLYNRIGDSIDVVFLCGTDFGSQDSAFCSVDTFEQLYAPYYKKINDWIHQNTSWKTFKHSCGSVRALIPSLLEAGFDILNPVQCSAKDMDPRELKNEFGEHIVFWGGGVDTQKTLPFGTPDQVREEVKQRIDIFAENGGFVFNTIHNVQANTPLENLVAMFETIKRYR